MGPQKLRRQQRTTFHTGIVATPVCMHKLWVCPINGSATMTYNSARLLPPGIHFAFAFTCKKPPSSDEVEALSLCSCRTLIVFSKTSTRP